MYNRVKKVLIVFLYCIGTLKINLNYLHSKQQYRLISDLFIRYRSF